MSSKKKRPTPKSKPSAKPEISSQSVKAGADEPVVEPVSAKDAPEGEAIQPSPAPQPTKKKSKKPASPSARPDASPDADPTTADRAAAMEPAVAAALPVEKDAVGPSDTDIAAADPVPAADKASAEASVEQPVEPPPAEPPPAEPPPAEPPPAEPPPAEPPSAEQPVVESDHGPRSQLPHPRLRGRDALTASLKPRLTGGHVLGGLLCAALGFALVTQVRSTEEAGLSGLREGDLYRILDETNETRERLEAETRELEQIRDRVGGGNGAAAREEAKRQAERLAILAGTAQVSGPGIEFVIPDEDRRVEADALLDAVQELRGAGAESISIGPVRVVASSAFIDGEDGITVDGTVLEQPYRFLAIGDSRSLSTALEIPGGVLEVLRQRYGATATVESRDDILIQAVHSPRNLEVARPVG